MDALDFQRDLKNKWNGLAIHPSQEWKQGSDCIDYRRARRPAIFGGGGLTLVCIVLAIWMVISGNDAARSNPELSDIATLRLTKALTIIPFTLVIMLPLIGFVISKTNKTTARDRYLAWFDVLASDAVSLSLPIIDHRQLSTDYYEVTLRHPQLGSVTTRGNGDQVERATDANAQKHLWVQVDPTTKLAFLALPQKPVAAATKSEEAL